VISSEVSDKEIMEATTIGRQPATGRMQFSYTLPLSGKEIKSEWFQESSKTQGVLRWCELVNQAIREEREEGRARQKRLAAERRAETLASAPSVVLPPGVASPVPIPGMSTMPSPTSVAQPLLSDPRAFVQTQLEQARTEAAQWAQQRATATDNWQRALEAVKQWTAVAQSLGISATSPEPSSGGVDRIDFSEEDSEPCGTGTPGPAS